MAGDLQELAAGGGLQEWVAGGGLLQCAVGGVLHAVYRQEELYRSE